MKNIWMSKEILRWIFEPSGGSVIESEYKQRAYEIWNHANDLIEKSSGKFNLEDGIINLKRAVDQRLKLIEEIYKFKKNNKKFKNIHYLEILENFGIIRNNMMKKLLQIRNAIEHYDQNAPDKDRCIEFSDMVWYFLKATDDIVSTKREFIQLLENYEDEETDYGGDLTIDYNNGINFRVSGWFPNNYIKYSEDEEFYLIEAEKCHTKIDFANTGRYRELHKNRKETDLWIIGKFELTEQETLKFLKKIF